MSCNTLMCKKLPKYDQGKLEQFRNGTGAEPGSGSVLRGLTSSSSGCRYVSQNTNAFAEPEFRHENAPTFRTRGRIIPQKGSAKTRLANSRRNVNKGASGASGGCCNYLENPLDYYVKVTNDRPYEFTRLLFSRKNLDKIKNMTAYTIKQQHNIDISPEAQDEQQIMDRFISKYEEYVRDMTNFSMEPAQAEYGDMMGMLNELDNRMVCDLVKEILIGIRQHLSFMSAPLTSDHMIPVGMRPHFGIDSRKEFNDERKTLSLENVIGMPQIAPRLSMLVRGQI